MSVVSLARPARDCVPRLLDINAERNRYRVSIPERFNAVLDIVDVWASEDPDALAVLSVGGAGDIVAAESAADLARASRETARALLDVGVNKGDHVFVMLPRIPQWYAALLGAMRIGAIPMPGPNLLTPRDIAYRFEQTGATAAITDEAGAEKVDAAVPGLKTRLCVGNAPDGWLSLEERRRTVGDGPTGDDPTHRDDPLLLYFTSGTVAYPKMVQHSQSYALGHIGTARFWQDLRPGDLHWTVTDTGWAKAAWGGLFGQMHERAAILNVALGLPDPDTILEIIARHRVTSFCAPPTLYRRLIHADFSKYDLSALRQCTSAGEPLNPEVIREWRDGTGGLTVYDGYGQTETTCLVANYRSMEVRPGSMGRPVPGYDVTIVDDEGQPVEPRVVGNVVVRCEPDRPVGLFPGYHNDPSATARAFRGPFYFTGDRAAMDADGYFWFEGRDDDVITSSAYRIGPFEVESVLVEHPAVLEAAVVGKDDPERTQIVTAFCTLAPGHTGSPELARELQTFVKKGTAPYKYPREIHFVDELPKTISGKIRRSELRDELRAKHTE
jgi:acyl-coenzyme A synthetase/AMP-(fatty) acid ligase